MSNSEKIRDFIYHEADLLDQRRFDTWYDLFTDDAIYWMPLKRDQQEEDLHNTLFFEDKLLLQVRIRRLAHPKVFSQSPPSYCQHVLQRPKIERSSNANLVTTSTPFIYVESQGDDQIVLAGVTQHQLKINNDAFMIYRKCIRLLNTEAALPSIQLFP